MTEKELYVQESSEGDYLVIKPIPGQVVAQVDPGPHMQEYARLFAGAPKLLDALKEIIRIHDDDWSEKYRETGLASDMVDIAREVLAEME